MDLKPHPCKWRGSGVSFMQGIVFSWSSSKCKKNERNRTGSSAEGSFRQRENIHQQLSIVMVRNPLKFTNLQRWFFHNASRKYLAVGLRMLMLDVVSIAVTARTHCPVSHMPGLLPFLDALCCCCCWKPSIARSAWKWERRVKRGKVERRQKCANPPHDAAHLRRFTVQNIPWTSHYNGGIWIELL